MLTFLHVGGKICPNPVTLAVNDALLLKLAYSCPPALDSRSMMRIFGGPLIPGLWKRNRLHTS